MSQNIQNKVHAVCRQARKLVVLHGLCCFVAAVLSAGMLLGMADYLVRFRDPGIRIICSVILLAVSLWSLRRFLLPAVRSRFRDVEVAQRIERRFPKLGDRLSSTIAFLETSQGEGDSPTLRQAVIVETERAVTTLDLFECLNWHSLRRVLLRAVPIMLILALAALLDFDSTSRAARRLVAPWNRDAWPRWNHLTFVTTPQRIAAGQDFEAVLIDRNGHLPHDVIVQYWFDGASGSEIDSRVMRRVDQQMVSRRENVTRSFKYRAVGGDDDTMQWIRLEVVEPANVEDFLIQLRPPQYSGIAASKQLGGPLRLLAGSQIEMTGRTSRPVESVAAHIEIGGEIQSYPATLSADGGRFTITDLPADTVGYGQYWLEVVEADGVVSGHETRGVWHVSADVPPQVTILGPDDDDYFTPSALIPLRVQASDDLAIRTVKLRFGDEVIDLSAAPIEAPERVFPMDEEDVRETSYTWDLSPLRMQPGDVLDFQLVATDFKPQDSEIVAGSVTIISQKEFDSRFHDRQRILWQRLTEALRVQRSTQHQVQSLHLQITTAGRLMADDLVVLQVSELQQRQVDRLLGDTPEGARTLIAELLSALTNNRIHRPDISRQLASFDSELKVLVEEPLPKIQNEMRQTLRSARVSPENHITIAPILAAVSQGQDQVVDAVQNMLERLGALDDYRRFSREFTRLLREQQDLANKAGDLDTLGRSLQELSNQERAELRRLSQAQLELTRRFNRLQGEMQSLRGQLESEEPIPAGTLGDAIRIADDHDVSERMRESSTSLERNQLGNAHVALSAVEDGLSAVLDALATRGVTDLARRIRELERTAAELADLHRRQGELQQALVKHAQQTDPLRTSGDLERQGAIAADAMRTAKRLHQLQATGSGTLTQEGARAAHQTAAAIESRDMAAAIDAASTAIKRLDEAQQELADEIQQAQQTLGSSRLSDLKEQVVSLAERQNSLLQIAARLKTQAAEARRQASLLDLAFQQGDLARDTAQTREQLAPPPAFALGLTLAEDKMKRAERQLKRGILDADTQRWQADALSRLELLVAALQFKTPQLPTEDPSGQDPSQPPAGRLQTYQLAQLRLLHLMQLEIHDRTVGLEQQRKPDGTLDGISERELQQLSDEQAKLAELVDQMVQQDNPDNEESRHSEDVESNLDRVLKEAGIPGFGDN